MLTTVQLHAITYGARIRPALDPTHPQPGDLVRISRTPYGAVLKSDHRDFFVLDGGTDGSGRTFIRTICFSSEGLVRATNYADHDGSYPQFRHAAPEGPYEDPECQEKWRTGYTDAISFLARGARFPSPCPPFSEGYEAGVAARAVLRIKRPEVTETVNAVGLSTGRGWTRSWKHASQTIAA